MTFNAKQYPTEVGKSFSSVFIIMEYSFLTVAIVKNSLSQEKNAAKTMKID